MMEFTEQMLERVAVDRERHDGADARRQADLVQGTVPRLTMTDAIREKTGYDITGQSESSSAKPASASASKSTTRWARAS